MRVPEGTSCRLTQFRKLPRTGTRRRLKSGDVQRSRRSAVRPAAFTILFLHQKAAKDQGIHARAKEGANGVGWCVHDGFTAEIERSIHEDRYASTLAEFVDETVVERI